MERYGECIKVGEQRQKQLRTTNIIKMITGDNMIRILEGADGPGGFYKFNKEKRWMFYETLRHCVKLHARGWLSIELDEVEQELITDIILHMAPKLEKSGQWRPNDFVLGKNVQELSMILSAPFDPEHWGNHSDGKKCKAIKRIKTKK
jgi:hypothetical protein